MEKINWRIGENRLEKGSHEQVICFTYILIILVYKKFCTAMYVLFTFQRYSKNLNSQNLSWAVFRLKVWETVVRQNMFQHSMARVNLYKSEEMVTNTTAASKYIPKRSRICINRNPYFQTSLHKIIKNYFYEVNLTSQHSHLEVLLPL